MSNKHPKVYDPKTIHLIRSNSMSNKHPKVYDPKTIHLIDVSFMSLDHGHNAKHFGWFIPDLDSESGYLCYKSRFDDNQKRIAISDLSGSPEEQGFIDVYKSNDKASIIWAINKSLKDIKECEEEADRILEDIDKTIKELEGLLASLNDLINKNSVICKKSCNNDSLNFIN